jgi:hypothetical protein
MGIKKCPTSALNLVNWLIVNLEKSPLLEQKGSAVPAPLEEMFLKQV